MTVIYHKKHKRRCNYCSASLRNRIKMFVVKGLERCYDLVHEGYWLRIVLYLIDSGNSAWSGLAGAPNSWKHKCGYNLIAGVKPITKVHNMCTLHSFPSCYIVWHLTSQYNFPCFELLPLAEVTTSPPRRMAEAGGQDLDSSSLFRILVATDIHLGYGEKNEERAEDSFRWQNLILIGIHSQNSLILDPHMCQVICWATGHWSRAGGGPCSPGRRPLPREQTKQSSWD